VVPWKTLLSVRHHKRLEQFENPRAGSGNVLFADGHGDFFPRELSIEPRYHEMLQP